MKPYWLTKPKYGNIPKRFGGRTYHSTLEANYAQTLDLLKKAGELKVVEAQPTFRLEVSGQFICKIIPDFMVVTKDGSEEIHEVKGKETSEWRIKWRLMQALHPEFRYHVIKQGDF